MRKILIFIIILLAIGGGVWYFYIKPKQAITTPVVVGDGSFFPTPVSNTDLGGSTDTPGTLPGTGASGTTTDPAFLQLTSSPIAGYALFSIPHTISIPSTDLKIKPVVQTVYDYMVRYVSRNNGYVYEIQNGGTALQISNIFIPNIYEASFADNNNTAILRFLRPNSQTIATYSVPIPPLNTDGTRTQKQGLYLPDNINTLTVSPDQKQLARVIVNKNGAVLSTSSTSNTGIKTIYSSPFKEWVSFWINKTLYLQTKAASVADGFLYKIDPSSQRLNKVLGSIPGLTTSISPSGANIIYSQSTPSAFVSKIFNTALQSTYTLPIAVLPEKCAWLKNEDLICAGNSTVPNNNYPDDWYAGTMHFSDQLYRISIATGQYTTIYSGTGQSFDMTNLQVNEDKQLVYFIDKNTGLLWNYKY